MEDLLELAFRLIAGVFRAVVWLMDALFILDFFECIARGCYWTGRFTLNMVTAGKYPGKRVKGDAWEQRGRGLCIGVGILVVVSLIAIVVLMLQ